MPDPKTLKTCLCGCGRTFIGGPRASYHPDCRKRIKTPYDFNCRRKP